METEMARYGIGAPASIKPVIPSPSPVIDQPQSAKAEFNITSLGTFHACLMALFLSALIWASISFVVFG